MDEQAGKSEVALTEELNAIPGLSNARVVRPRRVEVDVDSKVVRDVFSELVKRRKHVHVSTIAGVDTRTSIQVVYLTVLDGIVTSIYATLDRDKPEIDTIKDIIPGARVYEREVYDMFGVMVRGNHEEELLVLPEDWPKGVFPLRKDVQPGGGDM